MPVLESGNMIPPKKKRGLHVHKDMRLTSTQSKDVGQRTFLAKVQRINGERQTMDVLSMENSQILTDIYMTPSYQGPMGYLGIMPELGTLVLLYKGDNGYIVPISYFVPDVETAFDYKLVERFPKEYSDDIAEINRIIPSRLRKMRGGEGMMASAQGAEIFLDDGLELGDRSGNAIRIRPGDSSIISSSKQNYIFSTGVWRSAGPIQRNSLQVSIAGEEKGGVVASEVVHSDGTKSVYVGGDYGYGNQVHNEYRLEVEDRCSLNRPMNDVNEEDNVVRRNPKVIFSMANYVGNDSEDEDTYGKFLAPEFISESRGDGRLNFVALTPSGNDDVISKRGIAWSFHAPKKSFFGFDKQGVKYEYMSESRGKNTGLSQATVARGGKREEWGAIREDNVSWDLMAKGGVRWVIGTMEDNPEKNKIPRSAEYRYLGGTYTEHGLNSSNNPKIIRYVRGENKGKLLSKTDLATYKKIDRVAGTSRSEIEDHSENTIGGNLFTKVSGSKTNSVGGSFGESSTGDRTISTLGAFSLNAINEIKILTQKRSEKIVKGSDEKTVLLGDDTTDIVVGNHNISVGVGDISRQVATGNISDTIGAGNKSTRIAAGNYDVSVGAGSMSFSTVGSFSVAGTQVSIASTTTSIDSAFVQIGNPATRSGVITMLSHRDYVTGAPLIPSLTVTAGL